MKFFVAFAAFVAVAVAYVPEKPIPVGPITPYIPVGGFPIIDRPIIDLNDIPVLVDYEYETPAFGPALIDFPVHEAGYPVVVGPVPEGASPLVQIIVNVAKPAAEANIVANHPKPEGLDLSLFQPRH